ncbi:MULTISPECIES: ATP-binding protein [unclassified Beijerinckia]|uniref:ATP-binding protein n=1 Tax=unclassified Beijerinckia TaxID=2638183 RepID=UPI000894F2BE|nr:MULTISPECIES: ATP-binding protein [unclassified Beijerinckia]MDH7796370.1 hypothetical protein [Beijerinckia sp. GAS462]SEC42218.1 hypothetical protein SAMN05443249_2653 [Beijerinckia sp. 28-YEA-48]
MQLAEPNYTDFSSGAEQTTNFKFDFNAKAAFQLMSGIAKDKIAYPIREICTNAWDAARGDFEVHLPTRLVPTFRVRDYGPGLSPDQMVTVYATFFGGTKGNDNDNVGGFGLGSKSPFAYLITESGVASFNVTSFHGGRVHHYVMSLNNGGMPQCKLMLTRAAGPEERAGLEVSFPVRSSDIALFMEKAQAILWHFNPRPKVTPILLEEPKVAKAGDNWTHFENAPFSGPWVRMGCVAYPINLQQLGIENWPWNNLSVLFDAPIGSVMVQTSREELGYDDKTKATLKSLLGEFEQVYVQKMQAAVDKLKTFREVREYFSDVHKTTHWKIAEYLAKRVTFEGKPVGGYAFYKIPVGTKATVQSLVEGGGYTFGALRHNRNRFSSPNTNPHEVSCRIKYFVYELKPYRSGEKIQALVDNGTLESGANIIWLRPPDLDTFKTQLKALFREEFENPGIICLDDVVLPKTVLKRGARPDKSLTKVNVYPDGTEYLDLSEKHLFIVDTRYSGGRTRRYKLRNGGPTDNRIGYALQLARETGLLTEDEKILVYRSSDTVPSHFEWLGDRLIGEAKKKFDAREYERILNSKFSVGSNLLNMAKHHKMFSAPLPSEMLKLFGDYEKYLKGRDKQDAVAELTTSKLITIYSELGVSHPLAQKKSSIDLNERWDSIEKKYPVLPALLSRYSHALGSAGGYYQRDHDILMSALNRYFELENMHQ